LNKLSVSRVKLFQECPLKYKYNYIDELRPDTTSSALVFGKAIDEALNVLILDKDLDKSKETFKQWFKYTNLNGDKLEVETSEKIIWNDSDLDNDLITKDEQNSFNPKYLSLIQKGLIILDSYNNYVVPKIKEVIACQKRVTLKNPHGDEIEGTIDLIARLSDDRIYLLDHKTSSMEYSKDSAAKSTQLILYNYLCQDEYDLDGVGFIVLGKNIWKQKTKVCNKCGYNGSGENHRTCPNMNNNQRCHGEWVTTINPKCFINIVLDAINSKIEELVLDTFDGVNRQIKNKEFVPNLDSCIRGKLKCAYYNLCHSGDKTGLVNLKDKK